MTRASRDEEAGLLGVDDLLLELERALETAGYPNEAMRALAKLALAEYRQAARGIDRRAWHAQLLAVARTCTELGMAAVGTGGGAGPLGMLTASGRQDGDFEVVLPEEVDDDDESGRERL